MYKGRYLIVVCKFNGNLFICNGDFVCFLISIKFKKWFFLVCIFVLKVFGDYFVFKVIFIDGFVLGNFVNIMVFVKV